MSRELVTRQIKVTMPKEEWELFETYVAAIQDLAQRAGRQKCPPRHQLFGAIVGWFLSEEHATIKELFVHAKLKLTKRALAHFPPAVLDAIEASSGCDIPAAVRTLSEQRHSRKTRREGGSGTIPSTDGGPARALRRSVGGPRAVRGWSGGANPVFGSGGPGHEGPTAPGDGAAGPRSPGLVETAALYAWASKALEANLAAFARSGTPLDPRGAPERPER